MKHSTVVELPYPKQQWAKQTRLGWAPNAQVNSAAITDLTHINAYIPIFTIPRRAT